MDEFEKKAENFFILGVIAEKFGMCAESASNYFKSLSALNDFMLEKIGLKARGHSERFLLLKKNIPSLYEKTDKLFSLYRRTYTQEIEKQEVTNLRKNVEEVFKDAKLSIPAIKEIESKAKDIFKK